MRWLRISQGWLGELKLVLRATIGDRRQQFGPPWTRLALRERFDFIRKTLHRPRNGTGDMDEEHRYTKNPREPARANDATVWLVSSDWPLFPINLQALQYPNACLGHASRRYLETHFAASFWMLIGVQIHASIGQF
jgi:hypothetical protein